MGYVTREVKRVWTRIYNSYEGIKITLIDEASFAQWVVINIMSITLTFFVDMTRGEKMLIITMGIMILVAELLNTGIEAAIDRIGPEIHPQSKKAKDAGCAAVFLTAIAGLICWLMIFFG